VTTLAQARYEEYLRSPRWRLLRALRRWLDGNRCRVCFSPYHLEVHHRAYRNRGRSLVGELRDCVTLCAACHAAAHRKGLYEK
jgi:5-methylcytosine-specific restriction endonuclease McrA